MGREAGVEADKDGGTAREGAREGGKEASMVKGTNL